MSRGEMSYEALIDLIGSESAERLCVARGGRGIYVPHNPGPNCPLVQAVGVDAALILADRYGGTPLTLPATPLKRARIRALKAEGNAVSEIARLCMCTARFVYKVLAEDPNPPRPPSNQLEFPV